MATSIRHVVIGLCVVAISSISWLRYKKLKEKKFSSLPILDFGKFKGPSATVKSQLEFIKELRRVCHNIGFFYLSNHGVSSKLCNEVFSQAEQFFQLPEAKRLEIENTNSPHFRGYSKVGAEITKGVTDWREQIDIGRHQEPLVLKEDSPKYLRLIGHNQYPKDLPHFQAKMEEFINEVSKLGNELMSAIAVSLELPKDQFKEDFKDPWVGLKLINYPAQDFDKGDRIGVGSHRDYGWLTFLMQDEVGGLQVQNHQNEWIDAIPIPNTFVINLGEMLQIMTNNYYLATPHRVINRSSKKNRISIPVFYNPNLSTEVRPLKLAAKFQRDSLPPMKPIIYGVNLLKGFTRSHTKVRDKYYSDLKPQDVSLSE